MNLMKVHKYKHIYMEPTSEVKAIAGDTDIASDIRLGRISCLSTLIIRSISLRKYTRTTHIPTRTKRLD